VEARHIILSGDCGRDGAWRLSHSGDMGGSEGACHLSGEAYRMPCDRPKPAV